jgi:hypothetical protein
LSASTDAPKPIAEPTHPGLSRRTSLIQTPGVATRTSESRRRTWNSWKAPNISPEEEAKWNSVRHPAAVELAADRHSAPSVRAQTPGEIESLGSLRLGTLSIVNGAPSPAPSSRTLKQIAREDDYFASIEAGSSPLMMKNARRHGHLKSKSSVLPAAAPVHTSPETTLEDLTVSPPFELDTTYTRQTFRNAASKYAQDYQAGIPMSPFASTEACTYEEVSARTVQRDAFIKNTTKSAQRPVPRTADSGYSSGGSLRADSQRRQSASPATSSKHSKESVESETLLSPRSTHSSTSRSSFESTKSTTQKRLQKRRPSHPELPMVQSCQSIPESNIPDVPNNVRINFSRRLSHTPGMECLTHTYPTKEHITADTESNPAVHNGTFAPEFSESGMHSRTPQGTCVSPIDLSTQFMELEPERTSIPSAHGQRRSLSLFRRKSTIEPKDAEKEDAHASMSVVDLGTIATSLGSSPYDAAMSRPLRKTVTSPTHPHQLGATLPRTKSMTNMDAEAAAEFARMRSKDRALVEPEMPQQRRRSYHNLKVDAGEAKASKRRPQSSFHDMPPVPTIDSSKHGVQVPEIVTTEAVGQTKHLSSQHVVNWDAHSRLWSQRRKSIGEGLRTHTDAGDDSTPTFDSRKMPREDLAAWGRYSGGLEYNHEGGGKLAGSAGTRPLHSVASCKSLHWRNQYGVDLSDVPIMLQRA